MAQTMALVGSASSAALTSRSSPLAGRSVRVISTVRPSQACRGVVAAATNREVWFPGNAPAKHLDGSMIGDYGFDPLGFCAIDDDATRWFQQSELIHCRTAMFGCVGVLFPELATKLGVIPPQPDWYEAGKVWIDNHPAFPFASMLFVELILCGFVEVKRWLDFKNPGSQGDGSFLGITDGLKGQSNGYPGGIFDPWGFSTGSEAELNKYKLNEIKNGRLAMISQVGYWCQYAATGKGPIDNLFDHLADPFHNTFATNGVSLPYVPH